MGCLRLENLENPVLLRVLNGGNSDFVKRRESLYLYGFQGQEKDDEVKGEGNSYTTEFRQYDPRLGRWLSLDPLMGHFPDMSPYVGFNNNPIVIVDPKGDKGEPSNTKNSTTVISSSVDTRTNEQTVNMTNFTQTVKEENGTRTTTTVITSISTKISMTDGVTSGDPNNGATEATYARTDMVEKYNASTKNWEVVSENTFSGTISLDQTTRFSSSERSAYKEWVSFISNYNTSHDKPFNSDATQYYRNWTAKAFGLGTAPYSAAGMSTSIPMPKKLKDAASKIGIPISAEAIFDKLSYYMVSNNHSMIHAVSRNVNSSIYKSPKTPSSKSKAYVGPSSWQDLFDGEKWSEWWNGK
jgi:RHS repeat-associated protein